MIRAAALGIQKQTGRPGGGFVEAMTHVGYARLGESESEMWDRALRDVLLCWKP